MFDGFYQDQRVFITGHTGFKGAWLCLWLSALGARVRGFSLPPPTRPSLFGLALTDRDVETIEGDVRDLDALKRAMNSFKPRIVIHMAAQSLVRRGYEDPVETYSTNVMGAVNLLEAVRECPQAKAVVNVTSDKCYANKEQDKGYVEGDELGGDEPYASSKACSELVAHAYGKSYFPAGDYSQHGVALASVRAGNVIGGGDFAKDRLIPDAVRTVLAKEPLAVRNPGAVRPWQHVLEPLAGYLLLAKRMAGEGSAFNGGWNFGPDASGARPVSWVLDRFLPAMNHDPGWETDGRRHPKETRFLRLDASKAIRALGWTPKMNLESALDLTAAWYGAFARGGENLRSLTLDQIRRYETEAA